MSDNMKYLIYKDPKLIKLLQFFVRRNLVPRIFNYNV